MAIEWPHSPRREWVAHKRKPSSRNLQGILGVLAGLATIGSFLVYLVVTVHSPFSNERPESYRYFVASTGNAAVIIGRIAPRSDAPLQRETVFGEGDPVSVRCVLSAEGQWAKLTNGSFVPARLLNAEVGGDRAPPCA